MTLLSYIFLVGRSFEIQQKCVIYWKNLGKIALLCYISSNFTHLIQLLAIRLFLMLSMNKNAAAGFWSPVSALLFTFPSKCTCTFAKSQCKSKSYVSWTNYNLKISFRMFLCKQVIIMSDHNLSLKHCRKQLNPQ